MTKRAGDEVVSLLKDYSAPAEKRRKRLPPVSPARLARAELRQAVVREVLTRPGPRCELAVLWPEIPCGSIVTPERPNEIEVDEIRGGSWRVTEMYDPARCRRTCGRHHDQKTATKTHALVERIENETGPPDLRGPQ